MKKYMEYKVAGDSTVEKFLRRQAGFTMRQIRRAKFQEEGILKNGVRCRVTEQVRAGDVVAVLLAGENASAHLVETDGRLEILYEDAWLLAVSKPAGLVTHPQGGHYSDTLANQVAAYFAARGEHHVVRPVGRLDKETSGIVLFAKDPVTAARLQKQREEGRYQKTYLAAVQGRMEYPGAVLKEQRITLPIGPDPNNRLRMKVDPAGYPASTRYRILKAGEDVTLLSLQLDTGRTHQIRVHMAALGYPLIGDQLYGKGAAQDQPDGRRAAGAQRALLHAWKVELEHPFLGQKLEWTARLPEDMEEQEFPVPPIA